MPVVRKENAFGCYFGIRTLTFDSKLSVTSGSVPTFLSFSPIPVGAQQPQPRAMAPPGKISFCSEAADHKCLWKTLGGP